MLSCIYIYILYFNEHPHNIRLFLYSSTFSDETKHFCFKISRPGGPEKKVVFPRMFSFYNHVVEDIVSKKKKTEINRHHFVYHEILAPKKTEGCFDLVTSKLKSHMTPVSLLQAAGLRWHHCLSAHWLFLVGPLTLGFLRKDVVWIGWLVGWEMGEFFFVRQDDTKLMSMSLFFHSFNLYGYIKVIYIYKCIMCV